VCWKRRVRTCRASSIGVVLLASLLAACSTSKFLVANAPTVFSGVDRHLDLPYGQDPRQRLDIYEPRKTTGATSDSRPVVMFWYGGSWTAGAKAHYRFVGTTLAERGFVAVLPDYRLYPEVTFPVFDADGARAVAWVEQHAQEFGGDPHRIVLMGHSAGAHTAAFLAFNHAFLEKYGGDPRSIRGLVGLSGPYTLVPDTDVLHATFPAPYTENDWQPIHFVDASAPPTLLLHGLDDTDVAPEQAVKLRDALLRNHTQVDLRLYPHRGHADTVGPFALVLRWRTSAVEDTVEFIRRVTQSR
jgi:acetyl esterase/lipase